MYSFSALRNNYKDEIPVQYKGSIMAINYYFHKGIDQMYSHINFVV